jgi:hypothetical protein
MVWHSGLRQSSRVEKKSSLPDISNVDLRQWGRNFVQSHGWAQTVLLIIGLITVLTVLGAFFIAAGTTPDKLYTQGEVAAVDSTLFAHSLSNLVNAPLDQGGSVTILNNGEEFLPALIDAIDRAKRTINFSVYIWENGVFSKEVLNCATSCAEQTRRSPCSAG